MHKYLVKSVTAAQDKLQIKVQGCTKHGIMVTIVKTKTEALNLRQYQD